MGERCATLRESFGGGPKSLVACVRACPSVLAMPKDKVRAAVTALTAVLGDVGARRALRKRPELAAANVELEKLFAALQKRFPRLALMRIREGAGGEWARWMDLLGS